MKPKADITPDPNILIAEMAAGLGWKRFFGELVDNSLDAGAAHVAIAIGDDEVSVSDDGEGCDGVTAMLTMGYHHNKRAKLGRYGVGLKKAALWAAAKLRIRTTKDGQTHSAMIDWRRIASSGSWDISEMLDVSTPSTTPAGTKLRFQTLNHRVQRIGEVVTDIGFMFAPAIRSGRTVTIEHNRKRVAVPAFVEPKLIDPIETTVSVDGLVARVRAGTVADSNPHPGFTLAYEHRVIVDGWTSPCGGYSSSNFFAWVELQGDWTLSVFKDAIENDGPLSEALHAACEPALRRATEASTTVELEGFRTEVEGILSAVNRDAREKRDPGDKAGTVEPRNTDRKRRNATKRQPGETVARPKGGLRVEWARMGIDVAYARVDLRGNSVTFNTDHSYVSHFMRNREPVGLACAAVMTWAAELATSQDEKTKQRVLPGIADSDSSEFYRLAASKWLAEIADVSGTEESRKAV